MKKFLSNYESKQTIEKAITSRVRSGAPPLGEQTHSPNGAQGAGRALGGGKWELLFGDQCQSQVE